MSFISKLAFVLPLCCLPPAFARQTQMGVDLTLLGLFPAGSYEDVTGPGLGALGGLEIETFPGLAVTVRSGYIGHMERGDYARQLVPVMGGIKLTSYSSSYYLAGEGGRVRIRDEYMGPASLLEDREATKTVWGVGVGSAADILDLRASVHVWDAANPRETLTISLSIAFLFWGY